MQILQQQSKMNNSTVREVLKKTSHLSVRQNGSHVDLSYNLEAEIEVICIPGGLKNVFFFLNIFCQHSLSIFFVRILCQYLLSAFFVNIFSVNMICQQFCQKNSIFNNIIKLIIQIRYQNFQNFLPPRI